MRPINLLPPESFERAKARRRWFMLAVAAAAYAALLVLVMLWWGGRASNAEDEVAVQQEINTRLRSEVATLAEAELIQTRYDDNVALVGTVLAQDVSWGRILNDLARMLPDQVWIDSFVGAASGDIESVGSIAVSGLGFSYPDVAALLRNFDSDRFPSVGGTWVTSISQNEIGSAQIVNFQAATSLTILAVSDRALERIPAVGP